MTLDIVNALAGWLVQRYGDAMLAGIRHAAAGDTQQRVFREVVADAIGVLQRVSLTIELSS